jgi:hypothetical protein
MSTSEELSMVNFTVSISEELKNEMDKFPNVNWSELTRKAIQSYLQIKKNPQPSIDFIIHSTKIVYDNKVNRPMMSFSLRALNKLDSDFIIDRILFMVEFDKEYGRGKTQGAFVSQSLDYQKVSAGEKESKISLSFYPDIDMLRKLNNLLQSTFWIYVILTVYVKGFESPQIKVPTIKVPIDEWKNEVTRALDSYDNYWNLEDKCK